MDRFASPGRRIGIAAIAGVVVLAALSLFADMQQVLAAFAGFNLEFVPIILGLTLLNYALRFLKWHYYLQVLGITVPLRHSIAIFLSGLCMSVTPAKLGEVFKSYLLNRLNGTSVSKSIPVVLAERTTDIIGLLILAALSFSALKFGTAVLLCVLAGLAGFIFIIQTRRVALGILARIASLPRIGAFADRLLEGYESTYSLFRPLPLAIATSLSVVSWGFECVALDYVLLGFGVAKPLALSSFAFAFSSLAGAISMVPGGLVVAEGSLAAILVVAGISTAIAAGATVIIRFCTLWFGVTLGALTLFVTRKRLLPGTPATERQAEQE